MSHPNIDSRIVSRRQTVLSLFPCSPPSAGSGVIPSATHEDSLRPHPARLALRAYRGPQQKLEIASHSVPRYPDRRATRMQSYDLDLLARGEFWNLDATRPNLHRMGWMVASCQVANGPTSPISQETQIFDVVNQIDRPVPTGLAHFGSPTLASFLAARVRSLARQSSCTAILYRHNLAGRPSSLRHRFKAAAAATSNFHDAWEEGLPRAGLRSFPWSTFHSRPRP